MAPWPFSRSREPAPTPFDDVALAALPAVALDFETTGLDTRVDRVIAIGAVRMTGGAVDAGAPLDRLVDPGRPIPRAATAIHGIADSAVAGAPRFGALWGEIADYIGARAAVGHNVAFDMAMLRAEVRYLGRAWTAPPALDLVRLAAALEPRARDLTLEGTAARWGVPVTGRHTALGDARAAAGLWAAAIARLAAAGVVRFGEARRYERRARAVVAEQRRLGWEAS